MRYTGVFLFVLFLVMLPRIDRAADIIGVTNSLPNSSGGSVSITNSGTVNNIYGSYNSGQYSSGGSNTITNLGTVGSSGGILYGSYNTGSNSSGGSNSITNFGTVNWWIFGSENTGLNSSGGSNTIIEKGTTVIGALGSDNVGDHSSGGSNVIINYSTATDTGYFIVGSFSAGSYSSGGSNTVINYGVAPSGLQGSQNNLAWYAHGGSNVIYNIGLTDSILGTWNIYARTSGGSNVIINSGTVGPIGIYPSYGIIGSQNDGNNSSGGANTITNSGTVTGDIIGSLNNGAGSISAGNTITNSGTVNGDIWGSKNVGAGSVGGNDTITNFGRVTGSIYGGDGNDTIILVGGSFLGGVADGGSGNNTLGFNNMGTVNGSLFGVKYLNFQNLGIFGGSTTLTGSWNLGAGTLDVYQGNLYINGILTTSLFTVGSGGAADINGTATVSGATTVGGVLNVNSGGLLTTGTLVVNSGGTASIWGTANVYGPTDIFGNLYVDGALMTSLLTVEQGGLLGGNGSIFSNVSVFGTVSPGHSLGTLNVNGAVSFMPGSTYIAQLAADGKSDLIRVNGPVSIAGGTIAASLPPALYTNGRNWNIISATDGISGSFSSIETNFTSSTINLEQSVQGGSLDLVIARTPYASFGDSKNQSAVGAGLDTLLPSATGSMANLLIDMDFAMNPTQLTATLKGLNPEMYTAFPASGLEIAGIFNRMVNMRQQEVEMPATTENGQQWNVWGQMLGDWLDRDTQDGVSGYTLNTGGAVFGTDRAFGQGTRAGVVLGYSSSDLSWSDPGNSGQISGKHVGVYGGTHLSGFSLNGSAGYTGLDNSAGRTITTPLFTGKATTSFDSSVWEGKLSGGYDFIFGNIQVGPTASLDYQRLNQDDFSETGVQNFEVQIKKGSTESLTSSFGIRLTDVIEKDNWRFLPRAEVDLVHQFKDNAVTLTANFVNYPEATFTVAGAKPDANEAVANVGLSAEYNKALSVFLDLSASLADRQNSRLLSGGLTWAF